MIEILKKLNELPEFRKACELLKAEEQRTFEDHKELVMIPAPSYHEEEKARRFQQKLEAEGFETVRDAVNNVYTVIKGTGDGPTVYMTAHLDTVFPLETPLEIVEKVPGKYFCPGINDDTAACAQLLGIARAIRGSGLKMKGTLILGGNVCEEGLGDLRGTKHFFAEHPGGIDGFISADGTGHSIIYRGIGSYRYEVCFSGPGGHSYGSFGMPNPISAMGRAIAKIADFDVPNDVKTTFNVGVVSGGTSVNSIAISATMYVDLRSYDKEKLDALDAEFKAAVKAAAEEENARWRKDREKYSDKYTPKGAAPLAENIVVCNVKKVGDRPVAVQTEDAQILKLCTETFDFLGVPYYLREPESTDANIPISKGIPGLTLGVGGMGGGSHSNAEWYCPENLSEGQKRLLLYLMVLLGVDGVSEPMLAKLQQEK